MHFEYTVIYMTNIPEHGGIYYYTLLKSVSENQIPKSWSGMLKYLLNKSNIIILIKHYSLTREPNSLHCTNNL